MPIFVGKPSRAVSNIKGYIRINTIIKGHIRISAIMMKLQNETSMTSLLIANKEES